MNTLKLSVRIITYNHEPWIAQCIASVLDQETKFDFEIIIGDDCSQDNTREIIFSFHKKYPDKIKIITSETNVGTFINSKRTLEACRGEFVTFLEGDDYWHDPFKLQKQAEFLEKNHEYGMVHSDCNKYIENKDEIIQSVHKSQHSRIPQGNLYEHLLKRNFIFTCSSCVRRELLEKYDNYDLYINNKFRMADYPRWLEISRHTKIGYLNESLATYRILTNSASHFTNPGKQLDFINSTNDVKNYFIKKYGCPPKLISSINHNFLKRVLILAALSSDYELALKTFKKISKKTLNPLHYFKYLLYLLGSKYKSINSVIKIITNQRENYNIL